MMKSMLFWTICLDLGVSENCLVREEDGALAGVL